MAKTISIGLDVHQGEAQNTKQKKVMFKISFWNFFSTSSILIRFPLLGVISQINESTDSFKVEMLGIYWLPINGR